MVVFAVFLISGIPLGGEIKYGKISLFLKVCSLFFNYMYASMSVNEYVNMNAGACKGQKRLSDPLELQFQKVMSFLVWVLELSLL